MDKFKIGDAVQLKSGGPKMIVNGTLSGDLLRCTWFAGLENREANFSPDALRYFQEPESSPPSHPPKSKDFDFS